MDRSRSDTAANGASLLVNVLEHHGVKGMHWGVRKNSNEGSSKPSPSADHAKVEAYKAKAKSGGVKALSNDELQSIVTRLNLEQQHANLREKEPSKFETGHAHVKRILKVTKTLQDIHNTVNSPLGKAAKIAVNKSLKK